METKRIKWGDRTWEFYKPKRNKVKLLAVAGFVVTLLITPCTNWMMIPLFKVLNKYPLWLYR